MTRDDVIRMAREASLFDDDQEPLIEHLERFFHMAQAEEREACAKVCEAHEDDLREWDIQQQCANAIRARGDA